MNPPATMTDVPPLATADLEETDGERRLIHVLRTRHYQWHTTQIYTHVLNRPGLAVRSPLDG